MGGLKLPRLLLRLLQRLLLRLQRLVRWLEEEGLVGSVVEVLGAALFPQHPPKRLHLEEEVWGGHSVRNRKRDWLQQLRLHLHLYVHRNDLAAAVMMTATLCLVVAVVVQEEEGLVGSAVEVLGAALFPQHPPKPAPLAPRHLARVPLAPWQVVLVPLALVNRPRRLWQGGV